VEKLNHKPIKLKGFDKDRIATVSDWDGGALATVAGGCNAGLSLRADAKTSAEKIEGHGGSTLWSEANPFCRSDRPRFG
jgi:hypothetical protein